LFNPNGPQENSIDALDLAKKVKNFNKLYAKTSENRVVAKKYSHKNLSFFYVVISYSF